MTHDEAIAAARQLLAQVQRGTCPDGSRVSEVVRIDRIDFETVLTALVTEPERPHP